MRHVYLPLSVIACAINVSCVPTTTLAPGAEQVQSPIAVRDGTY